MSDFVDPYFDESINDLRNLLGAKSSQELSELEAQIVFANEIELESVIVARTNDLEELLALHKHLFGDVYDWAGKIRTVDIKKNSDGAEYFLIVSKITDGANYVFKELADEDFLRDLPIDVFIERLSYFYDQLNYIHPFREGNGRVQRIFWTRVAQDAECEINWDKVVGDENDEASKLAAEELDLSGLKAMFTKIVKHLGA